MAIGLSTSGTLFGIQAAETTIRGCLRIREFQKREFVSAGAKLLTATASGYRLPADMAQAFLGDTGTHEVGHVLQAEQTVLMIPPAGIMQDYYAHSNIASAIYALLSAHARTGYRPGPHINQKLSLLA